MVCGAGFSGFEGTVKRSLEERIERAGLGEKFGEILVPTEEVVEIRNGQKRRSERKFFPGYVLVRMDCLLYTSPSPRDGLLSRMPSSA